MAKKKNNRGKRGDDSDDDDNFVDPIAAARQAELEETQVRRSTSMTGGATIPYDHCLKSVFAIQKKI